MEQPDSNTTPDATQGESVITGVQEEQNVSVYERHEPSFFAMVPKMAQMDLTPFELALYTNLKQTASDGGTVTKSNRTLAFETHMSVASVKRARKSLETKGYIRVEHRFGEHGFQNQTNVITIRDVWALNHHRFKTEKEFMTGVVLSEPGVVHTEPGGGSHRTTSKNHKSKTSSVKKDTSGDVPSSKFTKAELDAAFDAVKAAWRISNRGLIANYRGMLFGMGVVKGQWKDMRPEPALTIEEFEQFVPFAKKRMKELDQGYVMPSTAEGLAKRVEEFRAKPDPRESGPLARMNVLT